MRTFLNWRSWTLHEFLLSIFHMPFVLHKLFMNWVYELFLNFFARAVARFNSDNLFCREASMAEPNKEEFLISNCTKSEWCNWCRYCFSNAFTFAGIKMNTKWNAFICKRSDVIRYDVYWATKGDIILLAND